MIRNKTSRPIANDRSKEREALYRLIISQLFYDGHQTLAVSLTNLIKTKPPCPPSDRLTEIVSLGLNAEPDNKEQDAVKPDVPNVGIGLDLEYEMEAPSLAPEPALYETCCVTSHAAPCCAGAFSKDGELIATGSVDTSIKILDVQRILAKNPASTDVPAEYDPLIRTLYDHSEEVTCLEFHPTEQILISGSKDCTVKFFNYSKLSVKRAFRTIHEVEMVRAIALHPTGDYILVGTQFPVIRLYDVRTSQCFTSALPDDYHKGAVNMIKYSPNGQVYASCSNDGDIKIWDTVNSRCVNTFPFAHSGHEVSSIQFSRNSKYLLSFGKDSIVKLWDLSMSQCLIAYTGANAAKQVPSIHSQAVFNHTEDYVLLPDETINTLCTWDARVAHRLRPLPLGHNKLVRYIAHSPVAPAFLTCSDDFRARFWFKRAEVGE